MNRRQFTTALGAAAAAPALPLKAMTAAPVASTAVPNGARFWAIYMSHLHGTCSPQTLATMTGLDVSVAQTHLTKLISDGVLKPTNLFGRMAASNTKQPQGPSKWRKRVEKFMEEKQPPESEEQVEVEQETSQEASE